MPDRLLIVGPPASGKSRLVLKRFLASPDSWLITPTTTMAGHLQNEFARAGLAIRPSQVMTLPNLIESHTGAPPKAPPADVYRLIQQTLDRLRLPAFQAVARYRGFHRSIAEILDDVPADLLQGDLATLIGDIASQLQAAGFSTRNSQLRLAAQSLRDVPPHIAFDGFFSLSHAELDLIAAFAARTSVTISLPETNAQLLSAGFREQRLAATHRSPKLIPFSAPTLDREVEEIARRILDEAQRGRPFREIGVILRVQDPYAPALRTVFARFGIPARFYFPHLLAENPAVDYLCRVVRAMLGGWDHADVLAALRMAVSGLGATPDGDRFDFDTRAKLPARGLPLPEAARFLERIDPWRSERRPAADWAAQVSSLGQILPPPAMGASLDREQIELWQSISNGIEGFRSVAEATAAILPSGSIPFAEFWTQFDLALALEKSWPRDLRRNVVHVMDVFEARQWELPVVFVCGLTERHFPQYHSEDSLLDDATRRSAGVETSSDLQRQERFLFDLALSRATESAVLSYPRFNEKGDPALRSFFLDREAELSTDRVRPAPVRAVSPPPRPAIQSETLLANLAKAHKSIAATGVESFLQCPFQFFADKTLRLRSRPPAPRDRMDLRLQGSILHRALAEATQAPLFASSIFDQVFLDECRRANVPDDYRTEAVRMEMARNFEAFLRDRQFALAWPSRVEEKFELPLSPLVSIRGRIDRIDTGPNGEALVIDYKYSAKNKIRERVDHDQDGNFVQAGVYLLAAQKGLGLKPAGMLFCGLRKEVAWDGWHLAIRGLEQIGESTTAARLKDLMDTAAAKAMAAFEAIAYGKIAPQPADPDKCDWCDFRDICRVESVSATREAGA